MDMEALDVVNKLNSTIQEKYNFNDERDSPFTYITDGCCEVIEFFGHCIWSSEADGIWYEDQGETRVPLLDTVIELYYRFYYNLPKPQEFVEHRVN